MIFHLEFHVEKPKEFRFSTRLPFRGRGNGKIPGAEKAMKNSIRKSAWY